MRDYSGKLRLQQMHTDRTNRSSATLIGWYSGAGASDSILR
jgi:hypothetical protein